MAINVNTVYQTVLNILNKEQRGYMTPTEFNNISTQVQLQVFEKYFEDLNQQIRVPQADTDYADRVKNLDEKLAIFKTVGISPYVAASLNVPAHFTLPDQDIYGNTFVFYRLGEVTYKDTVNLQRLQRSDFYYIQKSKLTKSTETFPTYLYENNLVYVKPDSIIDNIKIEYIRKPVPVVWGFNTGTLGQYLYNETASQNFELHESEQTDVILRILIYAGIIIEDPTIVQQAAQAVQAEEINQKS